MTRKEMLEGIVADMVSGGYTTSNDFDDTYPLLESGTPGDVDQAECNIKNAIETCGASDEIKNGWRIKIRDFVGP